MLTPITRARTKPLQKGRRCQGINSQRATSKYAPAITTDIHRRGLRTPIASVVAAPKIGAATRKPTDALRVPGDENRNVPITSKAPARAIGITYAVPIFGVGFLRFGFIQS
jgi:hypothetical protein